MTNTNSQAIHLYNIGDDLYVAVEVEGEWHVVIRTHAPMVETAISHIVEPNAAPMAAPRMNTPHQEREVSGESLDNSALVAPFAPVAADGDTFIYTEMLDRGRRKGNNGHRLVKTFYHRSQEEFWEQWPTIKRLCDLANVRACTRLAPRSYKKVGREFTRLVVETALTENWAGMKSLYNRACGIVAPNEKLWLFDVDEITADAEDLREVLTERGALVTVIPSRRAWHLIAKPLNLEELGYSHPKDGHLFTGVQLHKDNPTNLYIPEGAD